MGYVYFVSDGDFVKIGFTQNHPDKRLKQLATGSPKKLYLLGYIYGTKETEKDLHRKFKRVNLEWFSPTSELIDFINDNNEMFVTVDWLGDKLFVYKKMKLVR